MPITTSPTAPSRADPATFATRADAYVTWQSANLVPEANALETNVNAKEVSAVAKAAAALLSETNAAISAASAAAYDNATGTSTTSMLISVANGKAFTTQAGKTWVAGMAVVAYNSAGNQMMCTVASYTGTTLTLDCTAILGSGTFASWSFFTQPIQRIAILSAATAVMNAITGDNPVDSTPAHGVNAYGIRIEYAATQFVSTWNTNNATVRTSPDGTTWTARTVTGLAAANVDFRMKGANGIAFGVSGTSAISKSTDSGVTWAAGTALPGTLTGGIFMAYNTTGANGTCIVGLAGTGYVTTDNGATWSALQTFPATFTRLLSLGTLFVGSNGSSTYTSTTGLTGSWTTTAMSPASATGMFALDTAGGIVACSSVAGSTVYRSTNGTSWTSLGFSLPILNSLVNINGNYVSSNSSGNIVYTKHLSSNWISRPAPFNYLGNGPNGEGWASNGAGVWVALDASGVANTVVARFEPALALARGLFSAI